MTPGGGGLLPGYYLLHRHLDISEVITAESSPLHYVVAGLEPGTFGFQAQVANHLVDSWICVEYS